jgi:hypothetical protein
MFLGVSGGRRVRLTSQPSVRWLSRKCGIPDVTKHYSPPRPGTRIALLFLFLYAELRTELSWKQDNKIKRSLVKTSRFSDFRALRNIWKEQWPLHYTFEHVTCYIAWSTTSVNQYKMFQKELYNRIQNVILRRVLGKRLYLKAYKLAILSI